MRIALLSFEYPPETGFGGIGSYTWYQARALAKLGHEVHVLAGGTDDADSIREHDGVRVYRFRPQGIAIRAFRQLGRAGLWWTRLRLENAVHMYRGLQRLLVQQRYDVIEMPECGAEGALINLRPPAPAVVRLHSPARLIMPYYRTRQADRVLCALLEQLGMRGAAAFSSCSHFLAAEARTRLGVRGPVSVNPNGIDLSLFDGEDQVDIFSRFDLPRHRAVVLFAGRMEERKGIHLCADIAAAILERHDVSFVFAGQDLFHYLSGTLLPRLAGRRLKGQAYHVGKLDLLELRSLVRQADVCLLPSLWENCPYSCLEAMAAGRAIVATNQGGMPELIGDGEHGLLAPLCDVGGFVDRIECLLADSALRHRLGQRARARVEDAFTDLHMARRAEELYHACLMHSHAQRRPLRRENVHAG